MEPSEIRKMVNEEMARRAAQVAEEKAGAAQWDLDVAVFFFAVLTIVVILLFEGVGLVFVAPSAAIGLALGWLMGRSKGKRLYKRLYDEELSKLGQDLEKHVEGIVEARIRAATREREQRQDLP